MPTPSIQTLTTDAQQVLNLESISAVRSVVAAALANANVGTPLNPNLTTQQLWNEFYQIVTQPKSDIESIIANQLMKFLYAPPAPGGVGADKQVIFNDGGVLAGDPGLTFDKVTNALTITGDLTVATNKLKVDTANSRVGINTTTFATDSAFAVKTTAGKFDVRAAGSLSVKLNSDQSMLYNVPTGNSHLFQINDADAMTLNATGLGVGASPSYQLHVAKSQASQTAVYVDNQQNNAAASSALTLSAYGGYWNLSVPHSATFVNPLIFKFGSTEVVRMTSVGDIVLAGGNTSANGVGITFPATPVASSDANTLDDYKEGSWTPTLNSGTFSSASCRYTKVGNMVTVFFDLTVGTGGGSQITNLPFTAAATSTVSSGIYTNNQTYAAGTTAPVAVIGGSSTTLFFRTVGSGVAFSAMSFTAGANLTGSISYFV